MKSVRRIFTTIEIVCKKALRRVAFFGEYNVEDRRFSSVHCVLTFVKFKPEAETYIFKVRNDNILNTTVVRLAFSRRA